MGANARLAQRALRVALVLTFFCVSVDARDKTDVIVLNNGDQVTGEIKSLKRGLLTVSTDSMGTLSIEWRHVEKITSQYFFEVGMSSGQKHFGSIQSTEGERKIDVLDNESKYQADHMSVVSLTPIEANFLQGVNLLVDLGFDLKRANRIKNFRFGTSASYRSEHHSAQVNFESSFDRQETESSTRNVLGLQYRRHFGNRWFATALSNFTQSEEQSLDLRSAVGGGGGMNLVNTNNLNLSIMGGALVNREHFSGEPIQTGVDGLGGLTLEIFKFDKPEIDLTTTFFAMPSLSDFGRFRLDLTTKIRIELIKDLYWGADLFDTYDSDTPDGGKNDYGISTIVGWSF